VRYKSAGENSFAEVTFWAGSSRVGVYKYTPAGSGWTLSAVVTQTGWIAGRQVKPQDRLGSDLSGGRMLLPFGEELVPTVNGMDKFATYWRDETGLDYADQRYHLPGEGRFATADPYETSAGAGDPSSWNRYAYVGGDPVNFTDIRGLAKEKLEDSGLVFTSDKNYTYQEVSASPIDGGLETYALMAMLQRGERVRRSLERTLTCQIIDAKERALALSCNEDVRKAMAKAWGQSSNGSSGVEAGFRMDGSDSSYQIVENAYTNQQAQQSMTINARGENRTFAIFHVHPNNSGPQPSTPTTSSNRVGDTGVADRYGIDMFVMSSRGLWYYDHTLRKSFEIQEGLEWTKPCK